MKDRAVFRNSVVNPVNINCDVQRPVLGMHLGEFKFSILDGSNRHERRLSGIRNNETGLPGTGNWRPTGYPARSWYAQSIEFMELLSC
jgi:hypothetical protein